MARKGENIFKRKDGRWEGRYIKEQKNHKTIYGYVYGKTYSETKKKKQAAISSLKATQNTSNSNTEQQPLMEEVCMIWLNELKPVRKKSTIAKYNNHLKNHILPFFGSRRIDEIKNNDLITFSNELLTGSQNDGIPLAPKTVTDIITLMKSIHKFALIQGYTVNYMPNCVTIPQPKTDIRILSLSEEESLLNYLRENTDLTSLGILVSLFTGIRIGELCALMWNDISLDDQTLRVQRTMQRLQKHDETSKNKTYINIEEPKSKSSIRTIPIPDNIMDRLRQAYVENSYLLTGHPEIYVEPRTMENRFKTILKKCGIENANYHALRHTFATRCVEAGFDLKCLSEILGHANVNITLNRYVHPDMRFKQENMNKLSVLFNVTSDAPTV